MFGIPKNATKLTVRAGNEAISIKEINMVDTEHNIKGDSILQILEKNKLEDEYYVFNAGGESYPVHMFNFNGDQIWTSDMVIGDGSDVGGAQDYASNTVIVKVNGNLTIEDGVTVSPYSTNYGGPKGFLIYVTGKLTNNGTIDNSHGAYAEGQNVYLWKNTDGTYEYIPAAGAIGGYNPGANRVGNAGYAGTGRQTGGGGTGATWDSGTQNGATGTSYSGGSGSAGYGPAGYGNSGGTTGNGGPGGWSDRQGGGAGNPGGRGGPGSNNSIDPTMSKGGNGTGGLLVIYANEYENNGSLTATGSQGGYAQMGGGGSGGGSINLFIENDITNDGTVNINGGAGGGATSRGGGAGGRGTYTKYLTKELTVTLELNGGQLNETTLPVNINKPIGVLPTPVNGSMLFGGWYLEPEFINKVESDYIVTENITIYAKWGEAFLLGYSGTEETFVAPESGLYKLEVWGAQGGNATCNTSGTEGGYGGYSVGAINLNQNDTLYINVGGQGKTVTNKNEKTAGGYNGGGSAYGGDGNGNSYGGKDCTGAGGGATHIATSSGLLSSFSNSLDDLLIGAGGGGGSAWYFAYGAYLCYGTGGSGGGMNGLDSYNWATNSCGGIAAVQGKGGTQSAGGIAQTNGGAGSFGLGGFHDSFNNAGGGGGFFGGSSSSAHGAGGGSGDIGNAKLLNKQMTCYNCAASNDEGTRTVSNTCVSNDPKANCSKQGDGYVKITRVGD